MQKTKIILAISFIILVTLACNALLPLSQSHDGIPQTEDAVPRVTVEEAKAAVDSGAAVIVDVRSKEAYEASHIAGALFVPLGEFESSIAGLDLDKEQWIITYCT